jgi:hypothetical protein
MHLPVDEAEYHLQVLSDARSPASLQLLGYASAAQRAAGVSRLVLHALVRLLRGDVGGDAPGLVAGELGPRQRLPATALRVRHKKLPAAFSGPARGLRRRRAIR